MLIIAGATKGSLEGTGDYDKITPLRLSFILDQFEISRFLLSNSVEHEEIKKQVKERLNAARKRIAEGEPQMCNRAEYNTLNTQELLAYRLCRDRYSSDIKEWHKTKKNLVRYEKMLSVIREAI